MKSRELVGAAAGALLAIALAGGVAWAATTAGSKINGCYQKNQGQLRVIDLGADTCRPSEEGIAWSQAGIPGEKGDAGDRGASGRDGRDGRDGTSATVEPESPGAHCPTGGAKVVSASGVTYVCSAAPPPDPGEDM